MKIIHKKRRAALLKRLEKGACVIISTNSVKNRSGDVDYPFRPDSDFFYLTGFVEPEAVAVFSAKKYVIFLRPSDAKKEIWHGRRLGLDAAPKALGADEAYSIDLLKHNLRELVKDQKHLYFDYKPDSLDNAIIHNVLPQTLSVSGVLAEMRLIKDEVEIKLMQKAADISINAHRQAMKTVKSCSFEYEIESIFNGFFTKNNAVCAYPAIVAGGENACILHYFENNKVLQDGDLLLIDAGAEFGGYAADITRTFPISGKFNDAQKQIYELVLEAQTKAIKAIKPGVDVDKPHKIAKKIIIKGLLKLGILDDKKHFKKFFMHGTCHWLGQDVHDVGRYKNGKKSRQFEAGMVTTVEPGIYIQKDDKINPIYWNIGIRIEDNILVTKSGSKVLTDALERQIEDIEQLII